MCDDGDVRKNQRNRCRRFVDNNLDALDSRIFHDVVGDLSGDGLDEIARRAGDDRCGGFRQLAVVEGLRQVVDAAAGAKSIHTVMSMKKS